MYMLGYIVIYGNTGESDGEEIKDLVEIRLYCRNLSPKPLTVYTF